LAEFAIVIPVFLLLVFGLIDGGRLIYTLNTVSNAARDAARVAIVNQTSETDVDTDTCDTTSATAGPKGCAVQSGIALGLAKSDVDVSYRDPTDTANCATVAIGCIAVVTVTGTYQPITPVIGQLIGTVSLTSTTKMPVERVCSNPTAAPIPHC